MVAVLLTFWHLTSVVNLLGDGFTHACARAHTHTHTHKSESQDVPSKNYKTLTNLSMKTKYDEHVPLYMWDVLKVGVFQQTSHCCQPNEKPYKYNCCSCSPAVFMNS